MVTNPAKPIPLRRQQRDFTRQRLVDAARELFLSKGARATSVDDIAKAAGTSRATFYAHFTDKQDVIRELARGMWEAAFTVYGEFSKLDSWTHASIGGWMGRLFEAWERHAGTTGIVVQELISELRADFLEKLEQRVDVLIGHNPLWNRFSREEGRRRACLLLFQLERALEAHHYGGWTDDRQALLLTLTDIWVTTLNSDVSGR